jgi:glycosyltransferase involved in cell wall biosynthesis
MRERVEVRPKIKGLSEYVPTYLGEGDPREMNMGEKKLEKYFEICKADIVILYECPYMLSHLCKELKKERKYKLWVYLDQVYKLCNVSNIPADKFLVFSEQWRMPIDTPQYVLNHAPSSHIKPVPAEDILALKEKLKVDTTTPVFLCISRNSARKRLDLLFQSFYLYLKGGGKGHLILLTNLNGFYNLDIALAIERIPLEHISVLESSVSDETVNLLCNVADYGINTSDGEGWGLMAMDMAYLGKPQIALDIGSYRTWLTDDTAVLIKPTIRTHLRYNEANGAYSQTATADAFAEGFRLVQTKQKPTVTLNWKNIIEDFSKEITRH